MEFTLFVYQYLVLTVVLLIYFCTVRCQPVVNQLATTTSKVYKERFQLIKQSQPIPPGPSFNNSRMDLLDAFRPRFKIDSQNNKVELERSKPLDKVKAVNLGEKTMRQSQNDDDDDEYDGGEYSGLGCGSAGKKQKESVPMMLIHEMDMLALEIPLKEKDKNDKGKEQSKTCNSNVNNNNINVGMDSVQTHWNPKAPSRVQDLDLKMRHGHSHSTKNKGFGIGDREGIVYNVEDRNEMWGRGMGSSGQKKEVMDGLDGRRDLGYILDTKRKAPYETGQRMKGFQYNY